MSSNGGLLNACCEAIDIIGLRRKWDINNNKVVCYSGSDNEIFINRNQIDLYNKEFDRLMNTPMSQLSEIPWFKKNGYNAKKLVNDDYNANQQAMRDYLDEMLLEILRKELNSIYLGIKITMRTIENMKEKYLKKYIL